MLWGTIVAQYFLPEIKQNIIFKILTYNVCTLTVHKSFPRHESLGNFSYIWENIHMGSVCQVVCASTCSFDNTLLSKRGSRLGACTPLDYWSKREETTHNISRPLHNNYNHKSREERTTSRLHGRRKKRLHLLLKGAPDRFFGMPTMAVPTMVSS